jgi:hypothetical protein
MASGKIKMSDDRLNKQALYHTPEELQKAIDKYFKEKVVNEPILDAEGNPARDKQGRLVYDIKPPTVAGLALFLGFCNRASMYDYMSLYKDYENKDISDEKKELYREFSNTIKKAIARVEEYAEVQLTQGNSVGAIFWLKNHGWYDKQEVKQDTSFHIVIDEDDNKL